MKLQIFSYRYGQEVLQHQNYSSAWNEITDVFSKAPLFIWPNKSKKVPRLDVVQQLMNTYFDRRLAVDLGWTYHPLATKIKGSRLKADFRKSFGDLGIQVEVQFGNMARWYSDIFKFQAGYSAQAIQIGISVVPVGTLARRIDQNIVNYERARRELPSAELSVTLPIVMIGLESDDTTQIVDVSKSRFKSLSQITSKGKEQNRWRVVNGVISGTPIEAIGPESDTGPMLIISPDELEEESDAVNDA